MSSNAFEAYYKVLTRLEGGYSNNKNDSGGETHYGLTRSFLNSVGFSGRPDRSQAKEIYHQYFWINARADEMSPLVACLYVDAYINHGQSRAAKILQHALGVAKDGIIGRLTLEATKNPANKIFLSRYRTERRRFYIALVKTRPKDKEFLLGWLNRIDILSDHVYEMGYLNTPKITKK